MIRAFNLRRSILSTLASRARLTTSTTVPESFAASESPTAIMLIPEDYPPSFRGKENGKVYAHKDDYVVTRDVIKPEVFLYRGSDGTKDRLFFRTSIKLNSDPADLTFTSATFLFDTGCCPHLNVSEDLKKLLKGRIKKDDGREFYVSSYVDGVKHQCIVKSDLPDQHKPANVMGLPMFFALGIAFRKGVAL
eukprot:gene24490-27698_t